LEEDDVRLSHLICVEAVPASTQLFEESQFPFVICGMSAYGEHRGIDVSEKRSIKLLVQVTARKQWN
jgi:hypothetical protein